MMQASLFRPSPLLLLAAALVALAALFAPGAQPAQASSIWSARLTVQEVTTNAEYGCDNLSSGKECSTASVLTDDTFTFDGVDYGIEIINLLASGGLSTLSLKLDKAIPDTLDTLVLYVGGEARLVFADGSKGTTRITNDTMSWDDTGLSWSEGDVVGLALTNERLPSPLRRVSLSVSPNPVAEGSRVTVTATLFTPAGTEQGTLASDVTIPLTLTAGTAEDGDYDETAAVDITIPAGTTSAAAFITTAQDTDADDETFTVSLGDLSSLTNVTSGPVTSVQVRITDDEAASPGTLSVDANPACGSAMTASDTPEWALVLSPAPSAEEPTEYWVLSNSAGKWLPGVPVLTSGSSVFTSSNTFGGLRAAYPGFTGFEYRLSDHPEVTASCTWTTGGI